MITEVQVEEGVPSNLIDHSQSTKAARSVMKTLCSNTSSSDELTVLTLPQFRDWLLKGIKMTALQRKSFAKVNQSNMVSGEREDFVCISFLTNVPFIDTFSSSFL
jgi:hypothetical protein